MYKYNFEGFCILRIFTDSLFQCWIAWKLWTFSRDFLKSKVISAFSVVLSFSAPLFWVHCCFVCICNPRSVCSCNSLCICICNPLCVSIHNPRCNYQARKRRHRWCGCLLPAGKMHPTLQAAPCQPTTFTQASRRWLTGRRSGAGSVLWRRRRRRRRRREYQQRCMKPVACPRRSRLPAPAREPPPVATCGIVRHHPVECAVPTSLFACLAENTNTNNNTYASTQNRDKIMSIQRYQMECVLRPSELVAAELANVALF